MSELRWHHPASGAERGSATRFGAKKKEWNRTHRIAAVIMAAVISWCTMVVVLGIALASTNGPLDADTPAGTMGDAHAGPLQVLADDSFLASESAAAGTVQVDACATGPGVYNTLGSGVAAASPGDMIVVQGGSYPETLVINKALTISASNGSALVGEYYVASREVSVTVTVCPQCTTGLPHDANAKLYYPASTPGGPQIACGGPFPAVVYAHGRRDEPEDWPPCDGWSIVPPNEDYRQAEGILRHLAASGIIALSVDHDWEQWGSEAVKGAIVINAIGYLRAEHERVGSVLEGNVQLARIGLSGHSMGGAAASYAAQNVHTSPFSETLHLGAVEIHGLGLIAPAVQNLPSIPTLVIQGTSEHPCQVGTVAVKAYNWGITARHLVVVTGANHFGYTDGICLDPYHPRGDPPPACGLDPEGVLPESPGWDNPSQVGGVEGREAHDRQQRAARNYLQAFFSHYLEGEAGAIDYLSQQTGQTCDAGIPPNCGTPRRLFDDLENLNVEVGVCSCL